jgi:hypothetical protein
VVEAIRERLIQPRNQSGGKPHALHDVSLAITIIWKQFPEFTE